MTASEVTIEVESFPDEVSVLDIDPQAPLYTNPRGLYGFQQDGIAYAYLCMEEGSGGMLCVFDTGTGKTHVAMALACMMYEDDLIDHVIVVAERNKITDDEWPGDWAKFTRLKCSRHHGPNRMKRLERNGLPPVMVTTYETGKADLGKLVPVPNKRDKVFHEGPLLEMLLGKRVLVILDESTKLKNRFSDNYKIWYQALRRLRKAGPTRILGLSATPIEKDFEDLFNQLRLLDPPKMPLIKEFEGYFIRSRDPYGRARYFTERIPEFAKIVSTMTFVKRKTDPDVINEFPKRVEEAHWLDMADDQQEFYEMLCDLQDEPTEENPNPSPLPGLATIKRMAAGHPASIIHAARHGNSVLAKALVEELGEDYLRSLSSVKTDYLLEYLDPIVKGQGAKVVVFSFFGPSILPLLKEALEKKKFKVYMTYGGMSLDEISSERTRFKQDPEACVLLSSDAGARGVNLPEATYVVEYESARTYALRTQRLDRIHRIDSTAPSVTCMTFFVRHSVEAGIAQDMLERNEQHDQAFILEGEDPGDEYISAMERRQNLEIVRRPRKRKNG